MKLTRRIALGSASALLAARARGQPAGRRTLRVVPSSDLAELDPTRVANLVGRVYSQMVFDTLYALDRNLQPQPMMVEGRSVSADQLTYTFTLRTGLFFHDGTPVTTRDVVASLNRWMRGTSIGGQLGSRVDGIAPLDARTFRLTLKQPFGLVEFMLAGPGAPIAAIMPEADATRADGVALTTPVGSGPFRFVAVERLAGARAVFERNPAYAVRSEPPNGLAGGRMVKVDRVEWTVMPDATTAANALVNGEVDFWDTVSPDLAPFLRGRGVTVRRTASLPTVAFVRPNFQLPPFDDVRARQALALLVDQDEMMQAVAGENSGWSQCRSFSVCGTEFGTETGSEPYRKPDVPRARQLLAAAGYKGETLVLVGTPTLAPIDAMTQVLAQSLTNAGAAVDVQMTDFPTMLQRINARGKPIGEGGWHLFAYYAIGSSWFHPLMNVSLDLNCHGPSWPGFPCDPAGEALRQAFLAAPDDAARKTAFSALQTRLWEFIPYVPAGQFDQLNGYRSNVSGVLDSCFLAYWNIAVA